MSKKFKLGSIIGMEGKALKTAVLDNEGQMVEDAKGRAKLKDATLADVCNELIRYFPKEALIMENITHGVRLKSQILACKDGTLVIEEAEHDWLKKMLNDEAVGPKIFGFNLIAIKEEVDRFERLHQPKVKAKAD